MLYVTASRELKLGIFDYKPRAGIALLAIIPADFGLASVARRPARAELDASATGNGMSDDAETVWLGFVGLGGRGTKGQPIRQGFNTFFGYLD